MQTRAHAYPQVLGLVTQLICFKFQFPLSLLNGKFSPFSIRFSRLSSDKSHLLWVLALKLNCLWTCPPKWQLCFSLAPKIPSPSLCPGCLVQSKAPFGNCCAGFQWVNTLRFSDAWFSSLKTKMKANLVSVFVNAEAFQNVLIFWFDQKDLILVLVLVLDRASFKKRSKKKVWKHLPKPCPSSR